MKLATTVDIPKYPFGLRYSDSTFWIGSCFAAEIGETMRDLRFDCCVNPFGPLYNPLSMVAGLRLLINGTRFSDDDLFRANGLWHSFMFHGAFSRRDRSECLALVNARLASAAEALRRSKYLFVTFGTAYVFEHKSNNAVVGNCHKLPSAEFVKRKLSVGEIVSEYETLLDELQTNNQDLKTIFSVSPIRHFAEGAHGNALSKAVLLLAADEITKADAGKRFYFPAYEILLDELRDYRFYASDMCHPSETARDYISERFTSTLVSPEATPAMREVHKLNRARNHRPLHTDGDQYAAFVEHVDKLERELVQKYPYCAPKTGSTNRNSETDGPLLPL
jgi:hypothetical protein